METYRQHLCSLVDRTYTSEEDFYAIIGRPETQFEYTLNENGRFHSNYAGTHYEPAIIIRGECRVRYFWLFDGNIKDCTHPYYIEIMYGTLSAIVYYSSERIHNQQPLSSIYDGDECMEQWFNEYWESASCEFVPVLDAYDAFTEYEPIGYDKSAFTKEWYLLHHEFNGFKFVD